MAMPKESIKTPDLSRNEKLAGKAVYNRGWNITYDEDGYAVKMIRVSFENGDGVHPAGEKAQPIEEALKEAE